MFSRSRESQRLEFVLNEAATDNDYLHEPLMDDPMPLYLEPQKRKPRIIFMRRDIIPGILTVLVVIAGFITAMVSFHACKDNEVVVLRHLLDEAREPTIARLEVALNTVLTSLESFYALYQFSPIPIAYYSQMVPYVYSTPSGNFPDHVNSIVYGQYVAHDDRERFITEYRSLGGDYEHFNITARDTRVRHFIRLLLHLIEPCRTSTRIGLLCRSCSK
jgi:hypothetical protein